jgi:hypothetical protein
MSVPAQIAAQGKKTLMSSMDLIGLVPGLWMMRLGEPATPWLHST